MLEERGHIRIPKRNSSENIFAISERVWNFSQASDIELLEKFKANFEYLNDNIFYSFRPKLYSVITDSFIYYIVGYSVALGNFIDFTYILLLWNLSTNKI